MLFEFTPFIWPFIVSASILGVLLVTTIRYRQEASARAFIGLLLALFIWLIGFIFEILAVELHTKVFWSNLQFIGITCIPIFFLRLAKRFTGYERGIRPMLYSLILLAVTSNIVIWTNDLHFWFRGQPSIDLSAGPFPVLNNAYNFWFYFIMTPISYLGHFFILFLLVRNLRGARRTYQSQSLALIFGLLIPMTVDLLYVLGISPIPHFNFTSASFSISGILIAWALFRYQLFDLVPLAHSLIIENLAEGMIVLDHKNRVLEMNRSAEAILETSVNDAIGKCAEEVLWFWDAVDRQIQDTQLVATQKELKSRLRYYEALITPIKRRKNTTIGLVLTIRDITSQRELFQKTKQLAISDPLTGIYNRRHFFELLGQELERAYRQHAALVGMMFDIDNFKAINDRYGHAVGDQVLIETMRLCKQHLRKYDLLGRYGGDEFAICLPQTDQTTAQQVAQRLCDAIRDHPIQTAQGNFHYTISIGLAGYTGEGKVSADDIMTTADRALYRAKQGGKNQIATLPQ